MSQNIKNTLYRFVTMRSPELIGDQEKANGFISYPSVSNDSVIISAARSSGSIEMATNALAEAVTTYVPKYTSIDDLKNDVPDLVDFARWLIANRTKLTVAETDAKIADVDGEVLTNRQLLQIWDDLHSSILTEGSPYLRDLLLSLIVADYFVKKSVRLEKTDEAYRKLAQTRVVIDKSLFDQGSSPIDPRPDQPVMAKDFQKEMNIAIATEKNDELNVILAEVERAENLYIKENQKAQESYQKKYDGQIQKAYADATIIDKVIEDSDTGNNIAIQKYENLKLPEYDFIPTNELEDPKVLSLLGDNTKSYVNSLSTNFLIDSLAEVKEMVSEKIKENNEVISENTELGTKQINVLGATFPVLGVSDGSAFTYSCCTLGQIESNRYSIIMTIKVPDSSLDVASTLYHVNFADGTNNTNGAFTQRKFNNSISLILSKGIIINKPIARFKGDITFSNGAKYKFNIPGFSTNGCSTGTLTLVSGGNPGSSDDEAPTGFGIQRLGIADYRKVEQEVCCYVPGEVSHIENIMAREYKEKSTRRLRRQEDTLTTSTEQETETLTETTSTGRFEMNQEVASIIAKDQSFAAAAGVSYSNAGFSANANVSYANNTSKEESNLQAVSQAKELTERALDRVVQKVREERVTKVIEEYEENSSHGFDNRKGDKHISGVYRWVDKIYNNSILNYGKRLMYEFMIPEPAAFHDEAVRLKGDIDAEVLIKPVDPRVSSSFNLSNPTKINDSTVSHWAGVYNAEVDSISRRIKVSESFSVNGNTYMSAHNYPGASNFNMRIPEGYKATYANMDAGFVFVPKGIEYTYATVSVGDYHFSKGGASWDEKRSFSLGGIENELAVSVSGADVGGVRINVVAHCDLTDKALKEWQQQSFNAIIEAYETKLAEYEEKIAEQRKLQDETFKTNPGFYRQIEKTVLRKNCITYLLGNENIGKDMILERNKLGEIRPDHTNDRLDSYAAKVKFFEQAFEWDIMSYQFYPFYWAAKSKWSGKYIVENNDPLFKAFLQSGMARVIITVRPGFEEMVNWYLATGQIWNGGQVPTIDDEEFVSIVEELQNPESVVEETWETRVPTSLTVIQAGSIGLNVEGLPCDSDCADWSQFDSDLNPIQQTNELIGGDNESTDTVGVGSDAVGDTAVS
ncbi:hypothetical protein D1818_18080 [Aquimarina sp. BL5]|uniref:hypothetical protein n=1 Tax=Aquimarina sp. BL5 TaxID=1714860 RepID=UPI000E491D89|nr:hypothetical protein [Aquimarina sp. BL5]AXT52649.1 hypothetical protein D1818_18080 [Aquimarina sp. BL5]RKN11713.1 hypothetical protein D7036_00780 [Aquimarina sp. BL5]